MGRTFEILKQAEATHFSSGEVGAGPVLNLADSSKLDPTNFAEAIPFIEVGGPRSATEGSPDVLSGFGGLEEPGASVPGVRRGATLPLHRIPPPPLSISPQGREVIQRAADTYPVSVAFRPLESLHLLDGKTGRVAAEIVAFHQPDHPVSKEYETLAEAIEAQFPMGGSHVLMFMGAGSGVGTTTVVLNLAFSWARPRNKRIVVVDAGDVATGTTHGSLVKKLGLSASSLAPPTVAPWREAPEVRGLQEIKQSNLFVLCSPIHSSESGPKLSAQGMRDILRQLRKQFDLILIDAPPPLCISPQGRGEIQRWELAALASGCDGVYLVVPQSAVETPGTDELLEAIQGQGIRLGGCVLTDKRQG